MLSYKYKMNSTLRLLAIVAGLVVLHLYYMRHLGRTGQLGTMENTRQLLILNIMIARMPVPKRNQNRHHKLMSSQQILVVMTPKRALKQDPMICRCLALVNCSQKIAPMYLAICFSIFPRLL